ncbi:MAG TPA: hypothetical protein ENF42_01630 [Candidatus Bathyarchaeota archaeon]|nr:hypothetical protein [Candidatus Bathyarchaeota archaeon]
MMEDIGTLRSRIETLEARCLEIRKERWAIIKSGLLILLVWSLTVGAFTFKTSSIMIFIIWILGIAMMPFMLLLLVYLWRKNEYERLSEELKSLTLKLFLKRIEAKTKGK